MIQRQRGHYQLFPRVQQRPIGRFHLLQIRQHIAVGQHRAFRHARRTAGILQESQIFSDNLGFDILHTVAML
ncbi:Uncharacterised protein [Salmonella enterica subsp. enterica serovar Dublin]|nr:Uncharacterised protein [Salmonella enterica subsp. enterica serovar Dublin]